MVYRYTEVWVTVDWSKKMWRLIRTTTRMFCFSKKGCLGQSFTSLDCEIVRMFYFYKEIVRVWMFSEIGLLLRKERASRANFHLNGLWALPDCCPAIAFLSPKTCFWGRFQLIGQLWAKYLRPIKRNLFLTMTCLVLNLPKISPGPPLCPHSPLKSSHLTSHCCPFRSLYVILIFPQGTTLRLSVKYLTFQTFQPFKLYNRAFFSVGQPFFWQIHSNWCLHEAWGLEQPQNLPKIGLRQILFVWIMLTCVGQSAVEGGDRHPSRRPPGPDCCVGFPPVLRYSSSSSGTSRR